MTDRPRPPLLWLVRHGETTWSWLGRMQGHRNEPLLTPKGRRQAEELAGRLASRPVERVLSSDLRRAVETALPIAAAFDLPVELDPRLRERNLGVMEGESSDRLTPRLSGVAGGVVRDPDACPPGGESVRELYERVAAFADDLAGDEPFGDAVVVAHGGVVRVLRAILAGIPPESMEWGPVENGCLIAERWPLPSLGGAPRRITEALAVAGVPW